MNTQTGEKNINTNNTINTQREEGMIDKNKHRCNESTDRKDKESDTQAQFTMYTQTEKRKIETHIHWIHKEKRERKAYKSIVQNKHTLANVTEKNKDRLNIDKNK